MNVFSLMESKENSFSKTDRLIYNSVQKFSDDYAADPLNKLIREKGFSQPSLTRFAKKLGFSGFNEFQFQLKRDLLEAPEDEASKSRSEIYSDQLLLTERFISDELLTDLSQRILNSHHTYFYGTSLSRMPAEFAAESLRILNADNVSSLPSDAFSIPYRADDVYICFSAHSGPWISNSVNSMHKHDPKPFSILVTMNPKHPFRSKFDQVIALPSAPTSGNARMVLGDTMAFMMFLDLLLNCITKQITSRKR